MLRFKKLKKVFIIAEAGVNHNGSFNLARQMIDAAYDVGADAVKFQSFKADNIVTKHAKKATYQIANAGAKESHYQMIQRLELKDSDFRKLAVHAKKRKILFLSSPFDKESVDLLDDIGIAAFKLASGEITNMPLIEYIAQKRRPIILSTGMSDLKEIKAAIDLIKHKGTRDIALLHCVTDYPAQPEDINLKVILTLKDRFKLPVGFSDHTLGITVSIAAVALGAKMIEKHFTLDRKLCGPDHRVSLEPAQFKELVLAVRQTEAALGSGIKKLTPNEEKIKKLVRRSIVAKTGIPPRIRISEEMLDIKRPGIGIQPKYLNRVIGKITKKQIPEDALIKFEDLR
ncbi:MAG: N-acetylneuraminate synthase [Candidatus Omnitrophica bacterium]|nr:N-acetylneuraminate synthase [Candidatus Omnitrophota bacterium]